MLLVGIFSGAGCGQEMGEEPRRRRTADDPTDKKTNGDPSLRIALKPELTVRVGSTLSTVISVMSAPDTERPIFFSCAEGCPVGLTVDRSNGSILWKPSVSDVGTRDVLFLAESETRKDRFVAEARVKITVVAESLPAFKSLSFLVNGGRDRTSASPGDVVGCVGEGDGINGEQFEITSRLIWKSGSSWTRLIPKDDGSVLLGAEMDRGSILCEARIFPKGGDADTDGEESVIELGLRPKGRAPVIGGVRLFVIGNETKTEAVGQDFVRCEAFIVDNENGTVTVKFDFLFLRAGVLTPIQKSGPDSILTNPVFGEGIIVCRVRATSEGYTEVAAEATMTYSPSP